MVAIEGGDYTPLYSTAGEKRSVAAFQIDIDAVTNGEFLEFVREHPEWRRSKVKRLFADTGYLKHWADDLDLGPQADVIKDSPVTQVSWFAARAYLKSLGKRLPSTDEWEFVARADAESIDASKTEGFARRLLEWYGKPTPAVIPPIATGEKNLHGVRGQHGLVWEWVRDFNNAMVTGESRGDSDLERRLYCAAGAVDAVDKSDYAGFMRYAFRSSLSGSYTTANLGFRGARSIKYHEPDETKQ